MPIKSVTCTTVRSSLRFYFVLKNEKSTPYLDRHDPVRVKIGRLIDLHHLFAAAKQKHRILFVSIKQIYYICTMININFLILNNMRSNGILKRAILFFSMFCIYLPSDAQTIDDILKKPQLKVLDIGNSYTTDDNALIAQTAAVLVSKHTNTA